MTKACACLPSLVVMLRSVDMVQAAIHLELCHPAVVDWLLAGICPGSLRTTLKQVSFGRHYGNPSGLVA